MLKFIALGLIVLSTCAFAPPEGTSEFSPPEHYKVIWQQAEACTGKHGDFKRVTWYQVPGKQFTSSSGTPAIGEWHPPHSILIASAWLGTDWVIEHEMIHDITGYRHDGGKRDIQVWGRQCHAMWGWLPNDDPNYRP